MNIHNNPYRHLEARRDHPGEMRCLKFEAMFSPSPEGYSPGCPTERLVLKDIPEGECIDDIIAQGILTLSTAAQYCRVHHSGHWAISTRLPRTCMATAVPICGEER